MTMVPAAAHQNLSKQHHHLYSGYGGCSTNYTAEENGFGLMSTSQVEEEGYENNCCNNNSITESDHRHHLAIIDPMAEDESRTNSVNEAGSSSKDAPEDRDNDRWLQLGIGGSNIHQPATADQTPRSLRRSTPSGLIELDLLPPGHDAASSSSIRQVRSMSSMQHMPPMFHVPYEIIRPPNSSSSSSSMPPFDSSFSGHATNIYFQHPGISFSSSSLFPQHQHQQELNWGFRPLIPHNNIGMASTSSSLSSSSSFIQLGSSYLARPFHHHQYHHHDMNVPGPSLDFRVVDPPRRPHSGIWFMLQASQNQAKEVPFLPQIPKSYLRIKDGRVTVRLIKKYLVNKLRLDGESEVEITCRGQQLLPFLTLQHVRDNIWSLRDALTLLSDSSTTPDHVMVLHYARTTTTT